MADDTSNRGAHHRARVSVEQDYEVRYFAEKHRISEQEAQRLIDRFGDSREKLDEEAGKVKRRFPSD